MLILEILAILKCIYFQLDSRVFRNSLFKFACGDQKLEFSMKISFLCIEMPKNPSFYEIMNLFFYQN